MMTKTHTKDLREWMVGAWRLVSLTEHRVGEISYPLGKDAVGLLLYDRVGRMSAQLRRTPQPLFAHDDWRRATDEEKAAAWSNYFGYFGSYTIDADEGAVIHHIEGSSFPNVVGSDQVRYFQFDDGKLILNADTPWGHVEIVWEKIFQQDSY
ncbi:MAG TPA: lipocalin-like domain-containing protein [Candidatus Baltobacteraceae bacterium]|jgi:hypothetical protein|nr:lipocalin-like domain-containing protein [Candidatus Baltobacteraceae bacterium]